MRNSNYKQIIVRRRSVRLILKIELQDMLDDNDPGVAPRRGYLIAGIVIIVIAVVCLVGLISGGVVLFHNNHESTEDVSISSPTPIPSLTTTNPAQLCPTKPNPMDITMGRVITPIPNWMVEGMIANGTWFPGCPVGIDNLVLLELPYWNCDQQAVLIGEMIVHKNVSEMVVTIFYQMLYAGYPIYKMRPMYEYYGNDNAAMADNNTSAFCCRAITNQPGKWSMHSYGLAIDVNTLINPYVSGPEVLPPEGYEYKDRSIVIPGTIIGAGGIVYEAFNNFNWTWGGSWTSPIDYQHFEYDVNGHT